jgi:hypothetical protein
MVIVTQNQYILASKINHVTMDEQINTVELIGLNGRRYSFLDKYYQITVIYTPEASQVTNNFGNSSGNRGDEVRECSVIVRGAVNAHLIFKNLIQQIREQMPDQLYLDTALERMLTSTDMESLKDKDSKEDDFKLEIKNATKLSSAKVRKTGKTKRASKKVLRGTRRKR